MSTKNLARTVIEGGRHGWDKYNRRISLRFLRHDNRRYCDAIRFGSVEWENDVEPAREVAWRSRDEIHADKTSPCDRFLISRAGLKWDAVRSEIHRRFSTKTLAGRHVVYAHLVERVEYDWRYVWMWERYGGPKFWVDDRGVLRHNPQRRY